MKLTQIDLDSPNLKDELIQGKDYLLTREGEMSDHTGIYKYANYPKSDFCLYSKDLQCYYTLPVFAKDIRLYKID